MRNAVMERLAQISWIFRMVTAYAVILGMLFSLPSAAHAFAGHHDAPHLAHAEDTHAGVPGAVHAANAHHVTAQDSHGTVDDLDTTNCCAGSCMAVAVLSLQPTEIVLKQSERWAQRDSQLPSREQIALLRPPRH